MFCHAAMLKAALPSERGADIDTDGVGFLAWLMAVLSAARRGTPARRSSRPAARFRKAAQERRKGHHLVPVVGSARRRLESWPETPILPKPLFS